jgi:hypothetical protein
MTWRTVLLLIGLLCCGSTQALAQTVDTSAADALTEQTSPVTQQVTTAVEELEPATSDVLGSGGSSGSGVSGGSSSSGDSDAAEPCEHNVAGGSEGGGGSSDSEGQFAASGQDGALAAEREPADQAGGGALGEAAGEDGTTNRGNESETPPTPFAPPEAPSELPFWDRLALLLVLGLGVAGFVAALTSHLLGRARAG